MDVCNQPWLCDYLKRPARIIPRRTVRYPMPAMPLPATPSIAISVDCFGPLPVTPRGSTLPFTDRLSSRVDTFAISSTEFTNEDTINVLNNKCIPRGDVHTRQSRTTASSSSRSFRKLSRQVSRGSQNRHQLLQSERVGYVNHTMARLLAMVIN